MRRVKNLTFHTLELFRHWYADMKLRFQKLQLRYIRYAGNARVFVMISY
jgi:hypothetical protein